MHHSRQNTSYAKLSRYGPGGKNCPCCGPPPSWRKRVHKAIRQKEKRLAKQDIQQELRSPIQLND